ncbi:MAG: (2Fe-2S)-binding protein [Paracoccus sp. (in: a-proteobacteria)]|uniref:(2Fe-2S)-binding protein n=1 Tax=Paracoccus sp. TaxID=267 RepID=UPI0026E0919B|nr:(2Fe-2S)-binding protein [Paracoccus sp. (in: a-proteobacteria)]MDO5612843.1 (2Fe-2S)-binding protein [Paracoccus sp. (in: a-proteobacteria)]
MIICHCTGITDHQIRSAVDWMRASDADTIITPGKIYRALGYRADCGGCLPLFMDTMRGCDNIGVAPPVLRTHKSLKQRSDPHEGRQQGHRVSKRRTAV